MVYNQSAITNFTRSCSSLKSDTFATNRRQLWGFSVLLDKVRNDEKETSQPTYLSSFTYKYRVPKASRNVIGKIKNPSTKVRTESAFSVLTFGIVS